MTVDIALVEETASLLLPQWHTVLILVNFAKPAGESWPGVGVVTTEGTEGAWVFAALHELGHCAFGLGDEYEYWAGCDTNEIGQDQYPTPLMDPDNYPNVTASLAPLKWASLKTPGVNIPTTTNPDCTQCDPQTSPVSADAVGAFEGAGHYHCGLFRPQFDCRMRKDSSPFCVVCQQRIRDMLTPYMGYVTMPDDLATDVEPWVATLKWRAGSLEFGWDVQLSTTPDFSFNVTLINNTVESSLVNNTRFGVATAPLLPATEYYWRVRKTGMPPWSWTAPRRFTTLDKVCFPKSPWIEELSDYHPWALKFTWSDVVNAMGYEIEVFETQDCMGAKPLLRRKSEEGGKPTLIDVKVKQSHWWRVRAFGRGEDNYGPWSACVRFDTRMPIVQLATPPDTPVYPWGPKLEWYLVTGAAFYTIDGTRHPEGFTKDAPIESDKVYHPEHVYSKFNLEPQLTALNVRYWWRVGVTGPQIVPVEGKSFHQEGDKSLPRAVINDGDQTVPHAVAPMTPSQQEPPFVPYVSDITFQWTHVDKAEQYEISLYPFKSVPSVPSGFTVDWNNLQYAVSVNRNADSQGQQESIIGMHASSPPPAAHIYGYLYSIRAIGPAGKSPIDPFVGANQLYAHPGIHRGSGVYYIKAPPLYTVDSHLIYHEDGRVYWNGGLNDRYLLLAADQDPPWSPTGKYEIRLYNGHGCGQSIYWSGDNDLVAQTWYYSQGGAWGSYRMRTHGDYAAFQFNEPWSDCFSFTLVSEDEQQKKDAPPPTSPETSPPTSPPAPVVFDEIGLSIGKVFISFMPVEGATSYEADVFQSDCADTSLDIGFLTSFAWTSGQVAAETLSLTPVLQNNGWVVPPGSCHVLTPIDAVPQTAYGIHVRASNDGGPGPDARFSFLAECS